MMFRLRILAFAVVALAIPGGLAAGTAAPQTALVLIRDVPAFQQVREGFLKEAPGAEVVQLDPDLANARSELDRLQRFRPAVVVALGTSAALAVDEYLPTTPQIFSLVLNPARVGASRRGRTGFTLVIDPRVRIEALQRLIPSLRSLAILRGADGKAEAEALVRFAEQAGIRTAVITVDNPARLESALSTIPADAQALVLTTEALFLKDEVDEALLLYAFGARVPVVGFTEHQVRLGGLAALEIDYRAHGQELARAAAELISGSGPDVAVRPIGSCRWVVNIRSAQSLNVTIPGDILSEAGAGGR